MQSATAADWPEIRSLLLDSKLPLDGAEEHVEEFVIVRDGERLVGCGAIERYGDAGLLRSVAVAGDGRSRGVGRALVEALFEQARANGIATLVLLTTTAADYFPRFGFRQVTRDDVPDAVRASAEFRGACPASAVVMTRAMAD